MQTSTSRQFQRGNEVDLRKPLAFNLYLILQKEDNLIGRERKPTMYGRYEVREKQLKDKKNGDSTKRGKSVDKIVEQIGRSGSRNLFRGDKLFPINK